MATLRILRFVKSSLFVALALTGLLIFMSSIQPAEAMKERTVPQDYEMRVGEGCTFSDGTGVGHCYSASCLSRGSECFKWSGACFDPDGGLCDVYNSDY